MDRAQRAGRPDLLRLRVRLLLLLGEPLQVRLEVGLLQPRTSTNCARELVAELRCRAFASVLTFSAYDWYSACLLFPWQEPTQKTSADDDDDRDRDQADEAGERDEAGRRAQRRPRRAPLAAAAAAGPLEPRQAPPLRRLDGLGLVEEVEFDVVVVVACSCRRLVGPDCTPGGRPERK